MNIEVRVVPAAQAPDAYWRTLALYHRWDTVKLETIRRHHSEEPDTYVVCRYTGEGFHDGAMIAALPLPIGETWYLLCNQVNQSPDLVIAGLQAAKDLSLPRLIVTAPENLKVRRAMEELVEKDGNWDVTEMPPVFTASLYQRELSLSSLAQRPVGDWYDHTSWQYQLPEAMPSITIGWETVPLPSASMRFFTATSSSQLEVLKGRCGDAGITPIIKITCYLPLRPKQK